MQRDFEALLWDINEAGRSVLEFATGRSLSDYLEDKMLRSAVEGQFGIIGEALKNIRQYFPEEAKLLSALPELVGFRNRLAHEYHRIENEKVWTIIEQVLPLLVAEVTVLLDEWHQG